MQGKSLKPLLTGQAPANFHKECVYSEYNRCLARSHSNLNATMYFDGRFKLVSFHGQDYGELYDLQNDPNDYENLWYDSRYQDVKHALVQKSFDQAVQHLCDYSMHRIENY